MKNRLFFGITGALFFWIVNGFRNKLNDELADNHYARNMITTIIIWVIVFLVLKYSK